MACVTAVERVEQTYGASPPLLPLPGGPGASSRSIERSRHFLDNRLALTDRERWVVRPLLERGQMPRQLIARWRFLRAQRRAVPETQHAKHANTRSISYGKMHQADFP
jgi:hypothetical protein